jgi:guanyl-specific ribonuclease Sa
VAHALGVDPALVEQVALAVSIVEHRAARRARRSMRLVAGLVGAGVLVGSLAALPVLAQATCTQTLPSPLVTLCADAPALASDVNGNFQQLVTWVQQKVGAVGSANVTTTGSLTAASVSTSGTVTAASVTSTGTVTAGDTLTASRVIVTGGTIQSSGALVSGTNDLGLYNRNAGTWMRFVNANGPFRFYANNGATGAGQDNVFTVETNGALTTTNGEPESTALLPPNFCVIVPRSNACPGNWDAREIKWDTEDSNNSDQGKDGRIAWDDGNSGSVRMRFCCRAW